MHVSVGFEWQTRGNVVVEEGKLRFPRSLGAGLYRLRIVTSGGTSIYIGESDDLQRRFAGYRNPGPTQQTNNRLNVMLVNTLAAGGTVELATAEELRLLIDREDLTVNLDAKAVRILFENAALVAAARGGADEIANL